MMKKVRSSLSELKALSGILQKPVALDPGFLTKTSQIQLGYGIWANMAQVAIGLGFGLTAVQVPQLSAPDSTIKITRTEASWIASILPLFSPIGCLLSGYLMDRFGRRFVLILCQAPMFVGWIYTAFAKSPDQIIIGRVITGFGCGMAMGPPRIFSTEMSLPNMRGVIGAFPALGVSIGISTMAFLGQFFTWQTLCFICSGFTLTNFFLNLLLPESPYYVLKTKSPEHAKKCLQKFRAKNYDIDKEMTQLREFKEDNDIRKLTLLESIGALFTKSSCKPFSLIIAYILITQLSGVFVVLLWTIEILKAANSSYDVQAGNFLVALTRLGFGVITSILLFRVGRKPLTLISGTGVTFSCFTVAAYLTYNRQPSIIPQLCFMLYMAFASLGFNILPLLMASELYPLQVRGVLNGITVSITSLLIFGTTKTYPLLADNLGLIYTMLVFGTCALLGTIFLFFFLPETKELTLQEIEEYYNDLRPTLVSQRRLITMQQLEQGSIGSNKFQTSAGRSKLEQQSTGELVAGKSNTKRKPSISSRRKSKDNSSKLSVRGNEALKIEDESYLQKYAKTIELQKSKESLKSKLSMKSKESLFGKGPKRDSKGNITLTDKEDEEDKGLKEIKETKRSKEPTIKSNESKKTGSDREKKDEKKDDNQPNTSKKDTQKK